jgi:hypothetical protein
MPFNILLVDSNLVSSLEIVRTEHGSESKLCTLSGPKCIQIVYLPRIGAHRKRNPRRIKVGFESSRKHLGIDAKCSTR